MKLKIFVLLIALINQSGRADLYKDGTADISRENKILTKNMGATSEITIYNEFAKEIYDSLHLNVQIGKRYLDINSKTQGDITFKEGKNIACFQFQLPFEKLFFCKKLINNFTGEFLEIRAHIWQ